MEHHVLETQLKHSQHDTCSEELSLQTLESILSLTDAFKNFNLSPPMLTKIVIPRRLLLKVG